MAATVFRGRRDGHIASTAYPHTVSDHPSSPASVRGLASTAALLLVLVLAGCGNLDGPQRVSRLSGTIKLANLTDVGARSTARTISCYGIGPYGDVHEGARVTVEDDSGNGVSTGKLGLGRLVYDPEDLAQGGAGGPQSYVIGFVVEEVPPVGTSWSVRIGRHRFGLPANRTSNLALSLG